MTLGSGTPARCGWVFLPYASVWIGLFALHSAWCAVLLYHAGIVAALLYRRPRSLGRLLCGVPRHPHDIVSSLVCAACGPALLLLWPLIAREDVSLGASLARYGLSGVAWWGFAAYYASVHPLLEEIFWRGWLPSERRGPAPGDLAFAGYHLLVLPLFVTWPWVAVAGVVLTLTAWTWRRSARRNGNLGVPIIAHALAGLGVVMAASLLR